MLRLLMQPDRVGLKGQLGGFFEVQFAYEQGYRARFDFLDSSSETTLTAMASGSSNGSYERYAVALSDEEVTEVDRRMMIQQNFAEVAASAVGDDWSEELVEGLDPKGSFGPVAGYWTDQGDGGRFQIAFVKEDQRSDQAREAVGQKVAELVSQGKLTRPGDVRIRDAEFSLDQIYAVNTDFAAEYIDSHLDPAGVGMTVSINVKENRADLYAEPRWQAEAQEFASRFPKGLVNIVNAEAGGLRDRAELDPRDDWGFGKWHAGAAIRVRHGDGSQEGGCTWGASSKTNTFTYVVTAAHCLGDGPYEDVNTGRVGFWNSSKAAAEQIGVRSFAGGDNIADWSNGFVRYYQGPRGDIATISTDHHGVNADYSCYLEDFIWCDRHITGRALTGNTIVGNDYYAALGSTEMYLHFELLTNDAPITGRDYLRQLDSNGATQGGDSGSGWKFAGTLHGIHRSSGTNSGDAVFTHAYYVENSSYLGRTICGSGGNCDN